MASQTELAQYIRFQLSQLRSLNKHHTFEDLARQFARLRICENILPATGPVGTGGDQGRDFETYRSYLASTPIATSTFLGRTKDGNKKLVFACSLQRKIEEKIKSDVETICRGVEKIDGVYYFCEADLPVAKRHALQRWSRDTFNAELEIFDGQAISEQLIDLDVFWIAEEYLEVPSEMYPRDKREPETYAGLKTRWLSEDRQPYSYADFFQVKYGTREATFQTYAKPDLRDWLSIMEIFRGAGFPRELQRRATYEICVAALRGQNNLTTKRVLVEEYFSTIDSLSTVPELEDATVLLSYCSSALLRGHFEIEPEKLFQWSRNLIKRLEDGLKRSLNPNVLCNLFQIRGHAGLLQFRKGSSPVLDLSEALKWWSRLVKEVKNAPLFPLEHFADLLCIMTKRIGEDPQFRKLTQKVDELLSIRSSGFMAADKCRKRALAYYNAEKYLLAIKEFHQAKIKWFSAETLHGSLLAMLLLSLCYRRIGLFYAAKYYSACVAYIAFYHDDDDVKRLVPQALFFLANSCYGAGEWLSFLQIAELALGAHHMYETDPLAIEESEDLQQTFAHLAILRTVTHRLDPVLDKKIDEVFAQWPIDPETHIALEELTKRDLSDWQITPVDSLWTTAQKQLSGRPFSDMGKRRTLCWKALGIDWSVQFENDHPDTMIAEELVSTLQIILADLANEDLCLLPTKVEILSNITKSNKFSIKEEPSNEVVRWNVSFPNGWITKPERLDDLRSGVFSTATAVLEQCSMLSVKAFMAKIKAAFSQGLALKFFAARQYSQAYSHFMTQDIFTVIDRKNFSPLEPQREFSGPEYKELAWIDGPGPGYSLEKAHKFLKNRYKLLIRPIRISLPRWLQKEEFRSLIHKLKEEGYLDWQILLLISNLAGNLRIKSSLTSNASQEDYVALTHELRFKEETAEDLEIPVEILTKEMIEIQKPISVAAVAKTWELEIHRATPDLDALKKLLDVRYNNSSDDIDHEDVFASMS